jgi:hypothetical protein
MNERLTSEKFLSPDFLRQRRQEALFSDKLFLMFRPLIEPGVIKLQGAFCLHVNNVRAGISYI